MYCEVCGSEIAENANYCPLCGTKINSLQTNTLANNFNAQQCADDLDNILSDLKSLEENYTKLNLYQREVSNAGKDNEILHTGISVGIGFFAGAIISHIFRNNPVVFLIAWITIAAVIFVLSKEFFKEKSGKDKQNNEQKVAEFRKNYEKQYEIVQPVLSAYLPADYWYSNAVNVISSYFRNYRADSVKEAINLYEEEMHRMRMENKAELILVENQKQTAYEALQLFTLASMKFDSYW